MKTVFDAAFNAYGKVITGYDVTGFLDTLNKVSPMPADSTVYVPGDAALEALPIAADIQNAIYGGMPIQIGYCNGYNKALNCLEYHRDSEVNIPANDIVLLVASLQKVREGKLDTAEVEAFLAPAGTVVQFYETTLHYAPCNPKGEAGFRVAVVLPKGTNTDKPEITVKNWEDKLLWARNKWLIAHPDSNEAKQGAFVGLTGKNTVIE
ncbi:MAG: DUF4867 family protein [Eubacteriales bacterium]|nr:DUF4867 family protein [Eubacteriales bacterium]